MINNEALQRFRCVFSKENHFLINPILLDNCGHCVCWGCLPAGISASIECQKCGKITYLDYKKNVRIQRDRKEALKLCLGIIFEKIKSDFQFKFNQMRGKKKSNLIPYVHLKVMHHFYRNN